MKLNLPIGFFVVTRWEWIISRENLVVEICCEIARWVSFDYLVRLVQMKRLKNVSSLLGILQKLIRLIILITLRTMFREIIHEIEVTCRYFQPVLIVS